MKTNIVWMVVVSALALVLVSTGCTKESASTAPSVQQAAAATEKPSGPPKRPEKASADDWCLGHAIPESMCTKCNRELLEPYKAAGDYCEEHGFPESACPECNPLEPPSYGFDDEDEHGEHDGHGHESEEVEAPFPPKTVIRLAGSKHGDIAGIEVEAARVAETGFSVRAPARVQFDQNAVAEVRAPIRGIVREVLVDLGSPVEVGTPLFVLTSSEVGDLQTSIGAARKETETAKSNYERQMRLAKDGITSTRNVEIARQKFESASARLASVKSSLRLSGAASKNGEFIVKSPIAGAVIRRPAVMGSAADPDTSLATIADAAQMWSLIDVSERDATMLKLGQPVQLRIAGLDKEFRGEVTWISSEVDPRTRTVTVRAVIENEGDQLRANQFAEATVGLAPRADSLVVPADALQRVEDSSVVFVEKSAGLYEPRVVVVGHRAGEDVEIRKGLKKGDRVVTAGAFLLKTELARDSIGAGCCEVPETGGD